MFMVTWVHRTRGLSSEWPGLWLRLSFCLKQASGLIGYSINILIAHGFDVVDTLSFEFSNSPAIWKKCPDFLCSHREPNQNSLSDDNSSNWNKNTVKASLVFPISAGLPLLLLPPVWPVVTGPGSTQGPQGTHGAPATAQSQQPAPPTYQNDYVPQPTGIYPKKARLAHYAKIN